MTALTVLVLGLRFLSEVALLVVLVAWGGTAGGPGAWALGAAAALGAAGAWGAWVAPRARRRLPDPARLGVETVLFAVGGAALAALAGPVLGVVGAGAAVALAVLTRRVEPTVIRGVR